MSPVPEHPIPGDEAMPDADGDYIPSAEDVALSQPEAEHRRTRLPQLCIARRPEFLERDVKGIHIVQDPEFPGARRYVLDGMDQVCECCGAKLWHAEVASEPRTVSSLCFGKGKVMLPPMQPPPEPLKSLLEDIHPKARPFLTNIRTYNSALQMASLPSSWIVVSLTGEGLPACASMALCTI